MLPLTDLSSIGMGTYRMSIGQVEHEQVLIEAMGLACNLIDTASNYGHGRSERLLGKVLPTIDQQAFIVTKGGYVTQNDLANITKNAEAELVSLSYYTNHCIHPEYINQQLTQSLNRLKRSYVDGYLLHNPEYFLLTKHGPSAKAEMMKRLKTTFTWLEEMVQQKKIRYYGISSNTLPFKASSPRTISLPDLLEVANQISSNHHFKLLQFPYNYIENQATQGIHSDGKSLIELAKENNLITMANRPLNANHKNVGVRLAEYTTSEFKAEDRKKLEDLSIQISDILKDKSKDYSLERYPSLKEFFDDIYAMPNFKYHAFIIDTKLIPAFNSLFRNNIPDDLDEKLKQFKSLSYQAITDKVNRVSQNIKSELVENKKFDHSKNLSLQEMVCQLYLDQGLDHVLVGMRKSAYLNLTKLSKREK